ncbi:MAG: bifunctional riboflavin kinase/FMN adenylyltransferase [Cyanobium sp.]
MGPGSTAAAASGKGAETATGPRPSGSAGTESAGILPTGSESVVPTGSEGVVPTVVSFWPHPRELLHGETRLRLDLPSEKLELLEPLGIRQLVLVRFDAALAALSPEAFVEQVLAEQLQARHVAVGDNFRFGAGRSGDVGDLARLGARHGIAVTVVPMLHVAGERISSSRIRRALAAGEIQAARQLLQRPYRFCGAVERGRGLGRGLGWPTANLRVDGRKFLPLEGVYAAWAWCHRPVGPAASGGSGNPGQNPLEHGSCSDLCSNGAGGNGELIALPAVMNLGPQPTVDPTAPSAVEVHLLDRDLDLSGAWLSVEPVQLLRRQCRFPSLQALSAQISADAASARELLAQHGPAGAAPLGAGSWLEGSAPI